MARVRALEFTVTKIKSSKRYIKKIYKVPLPLDEYFLYSLKDIGEAEIINFRSLDPEVEDSFRIRNFDIGLELSGEIHGFELEVTFKLKDKGIIALVESKINTWLSVDR